MIDSSTIINRLNIIGNGNPQQSPPTMTEPGCSSEVLTGHPQ